MKKILLFLLPFTAFAELADVCYLEDDGGGNWRIVCEGSGLQIRYEEVTNEVYVIENCEALKSALLSAASLISQTISENMIAGLSDIREVATYIENNSFDQTSIDKATDIITQSNDLSSRLVPIQAMLTDTSFSDSIAYQINNIECGSCPNGGGGSGGSGCCDFTEIINRLIVAEQQRAAMQTQLDYLVQGVISIAGSMDIVIEGLGNITNLLSYVSFPGLQHLGINKTGLQYLNGLRMYSNGDFRQNTLNINAASLSSRDHGWLPSMWWQNLDQLKVLGSINNFLYYDHLVFSPAITNELGSFRESATNYFTFFQGEVGVNGVLEDWQSEEVSGTYYEFLTNHYLSVVRGEQLSGNQASKTNWFSRIETLLASLVFNDVGNTNAYDSASDAASNSVNNVKDSFDSVFDGVSSAPSSQMELVSDIEQSMYESLRSFSSAFSSATLPSSVRLIYVSKSSGSRSLSSSDTVDVTVPVEGKLMDFVEIMRSASTLCWVFMGLWFMFKFSVWTVKKIYMLIRYVIDFFNMVAGGK